MRKFLEAVTQAPQQAAALEAERLKAFEELADAQRGAPEMAMLRAQHALAGGVLNWMIEHIGDLTHRMAEFPDHIPHCGYEFVKPKVEKGYRLLSSRYVDRRTGLTGFYAEYMQNMVNNGNHFGISGEEFIARCKPFLDRYAAEHRKLKIYNTAQSLAKESAIALGELRFDDCKFYLKTLLQMLETPEKWEAAASKYDPNYAARRISESAASKFSVSVPQSEHYRYMRGGCFVFAIILMQHLKRKGIKAQLCGLFDAEDDTCHHAFVVVDGKAYDCRGEMPLDPAVIGDGSVLGNEGVIKKLSVAEIKRRVDLEPNKIYNCERMMRYWLKG